MRFCGCVLRGCKMGPAGWGLGTRWYPGYPRPFFTFYYLTYLRGLCKLPLARFALPYLEIVRSVYGITRYLLPHHQKIRNSARTTNNEQPIRTMVTSNLIGHLWPYRANAVHTGQGLSISLFIYGKRYSSSKNKCRYFTQLLPRFEGIETFIVGTGISHKISNVLIQTPTSAVLKYESDE